MILPGIFALRESAWLQQELGAAVDGAWMLACYALGITGLVVRCLTVGFVPPRSSGRNTKRQRADELNTTGIYSLVRHPLYLGNTLVLLGLALATRSLWFAALSIALSVFCLERIIIAEEGHLLGKFGKRFRRWAIRTPAILPRFRRWKPADRRFSWKMLVRREYGTLFGVIVAFTVVDFGGATLGKGMTADGWLREQQGWVTFVVGAFVLYAILRFLRKHTRLLRIADEPSVDAGTRPVKQTLP